MNKINISILGYNGRLGKLIVNEIKKDKNLNLYNKIDRKLNFKLSNSNDIILDVSSAEGTELLLLYLLFNKFYTPLLIGTTGNLPYKLIQEYSIYAPIAVISNFSYGIPFLLKTLKNFNTDNWNINIREIHHVNKIDSPSGTAKSLANCLNYKDSIESLRSCNEYGTHIVTIENDDEKLEFIHKAKNRNIFAIGCLRYIKWILKQKNGFYNSM